MLSGHTSSHKHSFLRLARVLCDLSQRRVSQTTGISANRYFRLEHGITAPTREELERLAAVFHMPSLVEHLSETEGSGHGR
jgi:transcriptional regulator with XRE-family HTH domain